MVRDLKVTKKMASEEISIFDPTTVSDLSAYSADVYTGTVKWPKVSKTDNM